MLAQIETPELDQQLRAAQAQLAQMQAAVIQAEANMDLAKVTSGRTSELVRQGWTSRQQGDQDRLTYAGSTAAVDVARANVRVDQAQVDRLEELTSFERVTAPFDGVITARNTDVGALINAGAGSPATELFHMASTQTLRIFVAVAGDRRAEFAAGRCGDGDVRRVSGAGVPRHAGPHRRRDQPRLPHSAGRGGRGQRRRQAAARRLRVRAFHAAGANAFGGDSGQYAAVPQRRAARRPWCATATAELVPITIGRDYGDRVEVLTGLDTADEVILNPSDSLVSGMPVRLANHKAKGAA